MCITVAAPVCGSRLLAAAGRLLFAAMVILSPHSLKDLCPKATDDIRDTILFVYKRSTRKDTFRILQYYYMYEHVLT